MLACGSEFNVPLLRNWYAYDATGPREVARARASRRSARGNPWSRTYFLDPRAVERSPWIDQAGRERVLMPEPVGVAGSVSRAEARDYFGLAPNRPILVMPGSIDSRKRADLLVESFSVHANGDSQLFYEGRVSPEVSEVIHRCSGRSAAAPAVVTLDRFTTEWEFWASLQAADAVAVPYHRHVGSSGILARAAHLRKPVVASDYGWVGEATRRYKLGADTDVNDTDGLRG